MSAQVQIADILDVVCSRYGVRPEEIKSPRRKAELKTPRQIAMYLSDRLAQRNLVQIGAALLRDRTTVLSGIRKIEARVEEDAALRATVGELEIEALAIAGLRAQGVLPQRATIDAFLLAEKIVRSGDRFAMQVSVEETRALAEALLAQRAAQEALSEDEDVEAASAAPTAPIMLDVPIPLPPTLAEVVYDFLAAEAAYRRSPSLNVRAARERAIAPLRMHAGESAVAALLNAYDALVRAEYSLAEREAQERFQAAVRALSRRYSELVKEPANVEKAQG
ncbi:helix-turn-helix domain-containing protein [Methylocystis rosea]|nr:helix-turn-helix domain-containing protein [Methylocystis rosea]